MSLFAKAEAIRACEHHSHVDIPYRANWHLRGGYGNFACAKSLTVIDKLNASKSSFWPAIFQLSIPAMAFGVVYNLTIFRSTMFQYCAQYPGRLCRIDS